MPTHRKRQHRNHYFNPVTLTTYKPGRTTRTQLHLRRVGSTSYLPQCTYPIHTTQNGTSGLSINKRDILPHYKPDHHTTTDCFQQFISSLPTWELLLLIQHSFMNNSPKIVASLTNQPILIATDGSEKLGKGSYGWVLANLSGSILATGQGTAYGHCISSFCCEAYGILAATRFILRLRQFYHLPRNNNTITWWCDCKSLIQRLTYHNHPIDPNRVQLTEHNVEFAIRATLPLLTNNFIPKHLHSHQADHTP